MNMQTDLGSKEELQKRHYIFLSELQSMARELPGKFQQRLPYDLLSSLASALLDGTAFEIVKGLEEVQHLEEKSLLTQRLKMINDHKSQRHEMKKKHKELLMANQNKPHNLPLIEKQVERELEDAPHMMTKGLCKLLSKDPRASPRRRASSSRCQDCPGVGSETHGSAVYARKSWCTGILRHKQSTGC